MLPFGCSTPWVQNTRAPYGTGKASVTSWPSDGNGRHVPVTGQVVSAMLKSAPQYWPVGQT